MRNILLIALCAVIGVVAGLGLTTVLTPRYEADAAAYVRTVPNQEQAVGLDSDYTNSLLAKSKAKSFVPVFSSRAVTDRVKQTTGSDLPADQLVRSVSVTLPEDSVTLTVTVTSSSAEGARQSADAFVQAAAEQVRELEGPGGVEIVPMASAELPTSPAFPKKSHFMIGGLIVGLLFGMALSLVKARYDTRLRTVPELERIAGHSVLGALPDAQDKQSGSAFRTSEALRKVRTNLKFVNIDEPPRSIVITSSKMSEGKSFLAQRIAQVLAEAGEKVLLVDADLRRPVIADRVGIRNRVGLSGVLTGEVPLDEAIVESDTPGMFVLSAGQIPPNPSEILGSNRMRELVSYLRDEFFVIFDAPPLLPVTDATLLSRSVDGVILVARYSDSRKEEVQRSVATLEQVSARLLGVVFNGIPTRRVIRALYGDAEYGYNSDYSRYGGYGYGTGVDTAVGKPDPGAKSPKQIRREAKAAAKRGKGKKSRQPSNAPEPVVERPTPAPVPTPVPAQGPVAERPAPDERPTSARPTRTESPAEARPQQPRRSRRALRETSATDSAAETAPPNAPAAARPEEPLTAHPVDATAWSAVDTESAVEPGGETNSDEPEIVSEVRHREHVEPEVVDAELADEEASTDEVPVISEDASRGVGDRTGPVDAEDSELTESPSIPAHAWSDEDDEGDSGGQGRRVAWIKP